MRNLTGTELVTGITGIDHRMQKAIIAIWQYRKVIGKTCGLKPEVVYWIYTSVVRPILTDTALLWWKKASQISLNRKTAHLEHAFYCNCSSGGHIDVATSWYLY
jgi:hypothetical protein